MNFKNLYHMYCEAFVAILVFIIFFSVLILHFFTSYQKYVIKHNLDKQLNLYDLDSILADNNDNLNKNAAKDAITINEINKVLRTHLEESNAIITNNQTHYDRIFMIIIFTFLAVFILAFILPLITGYINIRNINYKQMIFAFLLHLFFITALEVFLLFVVTNTYTGAEIYTMFYNDPKYCDDYWTPIEQSFIKQYLNTNN